MPAESLPLVSEDDLERLLTEATAHAEPVAGLFGPQSANWRVNRESAVFLGAGRAALLQLAHPWVAVALEQHSSLMEAPIRRFHHTFRVVFTTVFGSTAQAAAAARSLHTLHTEIRGTLPNAVAGYQQGSRYEANFIPALRWVFATLVESAVLAYECVLPPLTPAEREAYYSDSTRLAALFGIPRSELPGGWREFEDYVGAMAESNELGVDDRSRTMAHRLLEGGKSWLHPPRWYRALTADWLPARFRGEFGLTLSEADRDALAKARVRLPRIYRHLPAGIRFAGPYHEAQARLRGRSAGVLTLLSNRFWMGVTRMPFGS